MILFNNRMMSKLDAVKGLLKSAAGSTTLPPQTSRPMKFPYTFTAKIVQFPWKFYYENNWIYRYYVYAVIASIPIFWKISRLSNSPENKAKWAEIRRKEHEEIEHRFD